MRAGFGLHRFLRRAQDDLLRGEDDLLRGEDGLLRAQADEKRFARKLRRHGWSAVLAVLALACATDDLGAMPPPPPRRPTDLGKPAAPKPAPAKPAPQTPAPVGRAPVDVDVDKLTPYNLPPASREKMRQCGDEWRKLKMAGKSEGLIWRSFAAICLTR